MSMFEEFLVAMAKAPDPVVVPFMYVATLDCGAIPKPAKPLTWTESAAALPSVTFPVVLIVVAVTAASPDVPETFNAVAFTVARPDVPETFNVDEAVIVVKIPGLGDASAAAIAAFTAVWFMTLVPTVGAAATFSE